MVEDDILTIAEELVFIMTAIDSSVGLSIDETRKIYEAWNKNFPGLTFDEALFSIIIGIQRDLIIISEKLIAIAESQSIKKYH